LTCENAPCSAHVCQNSGTAVYNTTAAACSCDCPDGFSGDFCEYNFPGLCSPVNPCGDNGTCVELADGSVYDCACDFGYQGENCTEVCETTSDGRLDLSIVVDVSGSLNTTPGKDDTLFSFMQSLVNMYDTVNQVKIQMTTFSETGVLDLPMGFYNELQVADAVNNVDWQGSYTNITAGIETAYADIDTTDDVQDIMILITDGFHSGSTENMFNLFDDIKANDVRIIALGFFGQFAFYSPNLFLMTNEVYHAANYQALLALDDTIFQTVCDDGTIHSESVGVAKAMSATSSELNLLQAAHDWFEVYVTFPPWLPEEWWP
jgi:hypothetical protein